MTQPDSKRQQLPVPPFKHLVLSVLGALLATVVVTAVATPEDTEKWQILGVGIINFIGALGSMLAIALNRAWGNLQWRYWWITLGLFVLGFLTVAANFYFVAYLLLGWYNPVI